ncbi:MAG: hypothetical protein KY428_09915 [Bacteroidetes bacterium]|nr:hypothetical protein [Bacteroidota bacterium]
MRTILLLLLLSSGPVFGQQAEALRAKQFTLSLQPQYKRTQETFSLQHFEAAYGWSRRQNRMFEIGLNNILATTQEYRWYGNQRYEIPARDIRRSLGLNAVQYYYFGAAETGLKPYVGAGWSTMISYGKHEAGIFSNGGQFTYSTKNAKWINNLLLSPGLQYCFSNLLIKLEVPISLFEIELDHQKIENPNIPKESQQQTRFTPSYFPFETMSIELGIGYRLYQ